jgi:hypothetical protein
MGGENNDQQRRLFAAWDALKNTVDERRRRRNQLAHFQVLSGFDQPEGRQFALRPALFNPNALFRKQTLFHRDELETTAATFGKASMDLGISGFQYTLPWCGPFLDHGQKSPAPGQRTGGSSRRRGR